MPWDTSTRRQHLPKDWARIRARILRRDGGRCTWTDHGERCPAPATDVDHITPGDNHHPDNLRSLCADHHQAKTLAEAIAARAERAALRRRPPEQHPGLIDEKGGG